MGLVWAVAWFAAGMALLLVVGPDAADVPFPLGFGATGFIAGMVFSGVLAAVEGNRSFDQMSIPRFAAWGAVGGLLLSAVFSAVTGLTGEFLALAGVFGAAGALSAGGTLALARGAVEQLEAGSETARETHDGGG